MMESLRDNLDHNSSANHGCCHFTIRSVFCGYSLRPLRAKTCQEERKFLSFASLVADFSIVSSHFKGWRLDFLVFPGKILKVRSSSSQRFVTDSRRVRARY